MPVALLTALALSGAAGTPPARADKGHGVDIATLDKTTPPTRDFYQFANGGWLKKPLPADKPSVGVFQEVDERNQAILRQIVEKAAHNPAAPAGSVERKIGDFYRTGMDEALADKLGAKPLQPLFNAINSVSDSAGLLAEIARLHRTGISAAFSFGVGQDDRDSAAIVLQVGQGGIGLPTRDYYFNKDAKSEEMRKQYKVHIANVFGLLGDTPADAAKEADDVFALETRLAGASLAPAALRDPVANYHKLTLAELNAAAPGADWNGYFATLGVANPGPILVGQPAFMTELGKALGDVPLAQWKTYLRWNVASGMGRFLSKPFYDELFHYSANFTGQKKMTPRWKRVLRTTDGALGEAVGQLFVARAFPPEAKQKALDLVLNLKAALRDRIQTLDWMGAETKSEALRKLDTLMIKVGYPDKWRDYSTLQVGTDSFAQNVLRVSAFAFQYELNKLGKPVDRTEWGMTPQPVNAYYNPQLNEIVFPAGILQPPFFDAKADDASNYGAIGAVIGHEMTHGFDDQGRQYDAVGNLRDWWTADDAKRFAERSQALVRQYGGYVSVDDVKLNGELTQGENIADLGGLKIAYLALEKTLANKRMMKIGGYTPEQRFFLAFAQVWREKATPQILRLGAATDPHSPARWRVLGTLTNFPAFTQAFGPNDPAAVAPLGSGTVDIW